MWKSISRCFFIYIESIHMYTNIYNLYMYIYIYVHIYRYVCIYTHTAHIYIFLFVYVKWYPQWLHTFILLLARRESFVGFIWLLMNYCIIRFFLLFHWLLNPYFMCFVCCMLLCDSLVTLFHFTYSTLL